MGLFFSSLTSNQVASAILTFVMMVLFLGIFLLELTLRRASRDPSETPSPWITVLNHMNYVDLWRQSTNGILIPRQLLFHGSITAIWLFLTIKVLEARRWA